MWGSVKKILGIPVTLLIISWIIFNPYIISVNSPFISNFRSIYQPLAADCLWSAALELETVRAAVGRSASRREAGIWPVSTGRTTRSETVCSLKPRRMFLPCRGKNLLGFQIHLYHTTAAWTLFQKTSNFS